MDQSKRQENAFEPGIQVQVGDDKSVDVVVRNVDKQDLIEVLMQFFSRGDPKVQANLKMILRSMPQITLTLRSASSFQYEDCGGRDFLEGPHGGMAVNFCCAHCYARFNDLIVFPIERQGCVAESDRHFFGGRYMPRGLEA